MQQRKSHLWPWEDEGISPVEYIRSLQGLCRFLEQVDLRNLQTLEDVSAVASLIGHDLRALAMAKGQKAAIPLTRYASVFISPTRNVSLTLPGRASLCRFTHTVVYPSCFAGTISYLNPKPACHISLTFNPNRSRASRNP